MSDVEPKKWTHPTLPKCTILEFGAGHETWRADHGLVDERGRKIGGTVDVRPAGGSGFMVRIQATRDGVAFGALRRHTTHPTIERAREAAENKLRAQRASFARKYKEPQP